MIRHHYLRAIPILVLPRESDRSVERLEQVRDVREADGAWRIWFFEGITNESDLSESES